jgi:phosphate transport system substrate-binding protein
VTAYRIAFSIVALLLLVAVPAGAATVTVTVGGTGSAMQALRLLSSRFQAEHPGVTVEIPASLGSSGGIRAVGAGAIDLSISARPLTDAERAAGLVAEPWGRTPLMVVVPPTVSERQITFDGLADILAGRRTLWANGEPIVPVLRPPLDADTLLLSAASPVLAAALDEARRRPGMLEAMTDQDAAATLTSVPGALGLLTLLQKTSEGLSLVPMRLEGQNPDVDAVIAGRYPLVRSYWIVHRPALGAEAKALLDYLEGPAARGMVRGLGMVPAPGR